MGLLTLSLAYFRRSSSVTEGVVLFVMLCRSKPGEAVLVWVVICLVQALTLGAVKVLGAFSEIFADRKTVWERFHKRGAGGTYKF